MREKERVGWGNSEQERKREGQRCNGRKKKISK